MYKPMVNKDDFLIHQYTNRSDFVFLVCIWWELRAMFSNKRAVIGPVWSVIRRKQIVILLVIAIIICSLPFYSSISEEDAEASTANNQNDNEFPITTIMVVVFILMICTVLLLLYFFYKYLIYVVIGLFAIASVSGTFECLSALMSFVNCGKLQFELKWKLFSYNYHFLQKQYILT